MLIVFFAFLALFTKDAGTAYQKGELDNLGRGTRPYAVTPEFGTQCAHVNCGTTPDPVLFRVVQCGPDIIITADSDDASACAAFQE